MPAEHPPLDATSPAGVAAGATLEERTRARLLREVLHDLREGARDPRPASTDYIYTSRGDGAASGVPFLSIVLVVNDATSAVVNDALVALDAQSVDDFELLVVGDVATDDARAHLATQLATFSASLCARARVLSAPATAETAAPDARQWGLAHARGRYVTVIDATSVAFAHLVETFAHLATASSAPSSAPSPSSAPASASSAAVLRARAIAQPIRRLRWPDGTEGFEPRRGALAASASRFVPLAHLASPATPRGSYALRRDVVELLGYDADEDEVLVAAAVWGGLREATDHVVVLLRHFED